MAPFQDYAIIRGLLSHLCLVFNKKNSK